jgi:hypothetical protein
MMGETLAEAYLDIEEEQIRAKKNDFRGNDLGSGRTSHVRCKSGGR